MCHVLIPEGHVAQLATFVVPFEKHDLKLSGGNHNSVPRPSNSWGTALPPEGRSPTLDEVSALANIPMPKYVA